MLAVRRGVRWDPSKNRWRPGGVLMLDSPEDVKPLFIQAQTQGAFAEEGGAREMAERVTGASDYSQGQSPSKSRTLGEIQAVLQEGNLKFDVVIQRLQAANNELGQMVLGLNRQFLDAETEYQITRAEGEDPVFATVDKRDLARRVGLRAHGNTLNSNAELELATSEKLYLMSERNPLMADKITRIYAVTKNYLEKMGIRHVVPYIGTEEEAIEQEKAMAEAPPATAPPNISGKMDEVTTLAKMIQADPSLPEALQTAANLLMQLQGQMQAANNFATASTGPENPTGEPGIDDGAPGEQGMTGSNELDQILAGLGA
jgi:hypothetical protein